MKIEHKAVCEEKGLARNVTNDFEPNWCRVNQKRHDMEWGEWQHIVSVDTAEQWKKDLSRQCKGISAYGGLTCGEKDGGKVLEWYHFVSQKLTWEKALENCVILGGRDFSQHVYKQKEKREIDMNYFRIIFNFRLQNSQEKFT